MTTPEWVVGGTIALAVAIGALRSMPSREVRDRWRRVAILVSLSGAAGALLYLTLFPPSTPFARGTLVVSTAGAPRGLKLQSNERWIALPEAPTTAGAGRVPDLATALRRDGRPERIRIVGAGLTARDRAAAAGIPIDFLPPSPPRGLIEVQPPPPTAAGSAFAVGGRIIGFPGATAELLDPSGRRVDARAVDEAGRFVLIGSARAAGLTLFQIRIRDSARVTVTGTIVPLWILPKPKLRLLVIGTPAPENKYLRRWAADAGVDFTSLLQAGGGVRLGDAPVPIVPARLRGFDAVIVDDRSWQALGVAGRGALAVAVADGLGLILRITEPVTPAARRSWAALGLTIAGGEELKPVVLGPLAIDADALAAQRGPVATDLTNAAPALDDPAPELRRWTIRPGAGLVSLLRDGAGDMLAAWRARGLGRIAIWAVADSYALVLAGQHERHFQWWSDAVTTIARAGSQFAPDLPTIPRAGQYMAICGLSGSPRVVGPDRRETQLIPTGAAGCAAFWPERAGLHMLIQPGRDGGRSRPFHVYPADALPAIATAEQSRTTIALAAAARGGEARRDKAKRPGPAWPWFLLWLAVSGLHWTLERRWRVRNGWSGGPGGKAGHRMG